MHSARKHRTIGVASVSVVTAAARLGGACGCVDLAAAASPQSITNKAIRIRDTQHRAEQSQTAINTPAIVVPLRGDELSFAEEEANETLGPARLEFRDAEDNFNKQMAPAIASP